MQSGFQTRRFPITEVQFSGNSGNESALLIHPLDPNEPKLEEVIGFDGIILETHDTANDFNRLRGAKIIELFQLNERDDLRNERVKIIRHIFLAKCAPENNPVAILALQSVIDQFEGHSNCARCYIQLWNNDPEKAKEIGELANS